MRAKILYLANYRFYPECDVRLDHQSKVEDFSKCLMYSHAPGILIISRCFSTKNWFLIYPASIGDTLRNPPHYSDGRVKHHIQGRSDSKYILLKISPLSVAIDMDTSTRHPRHVKVFPSLFSCREIFKFVLSKIMQK